MPLTTAQIVRGRVNAPFIYDSEQIVGDGTASSFKLKQGSPFSTISATATASIATTAGWSATGATFDYTLGRVTFSGVISANSAVRMDYLYSIFSEDEMSYFTAVGGGVPEMCLLAVRHLLVDYAKRGRWAAPDGSTYDDTMAFASLKALESGLQDEIHGSEVGPIGDSVSWPEDQQNWY